MSTGTGPPQGQLKYMTPYPIADDPPTPRPIPNLSNPSHTLAQRATARFSLDGKHAIGMMNMSYTASSTETPKSLAVPKVSAWSVQEHCSSTASRILLSST